MCVDDGAVQAARRIVANGSDGRRERDAGRACLVWLRRSARRGSGSLTLPEKPSEADIPGVVAMVATAQSVIYQARSACAARGAAGKDVRLPSSCRPMIKLLTSVAAMQLVEAGKLD